MTATQWALEIFTETGDTVGRASALGNLGNVYWRWGRSDDAYQCYQQAQVVFVRDGFVPALAMTLLNLSELHIGRGRFEIAFRHCTQAYELYQSIDDVVGQAASRKVIGDIHFRYGRYSEARDEYAVVLDIARGLGHDRIVAYALDGQGSVCARLGEHDRAVALHTEALSVRRAAGDQFGEVETRCCLALALHLSGDHGDAAAECRNTLTLAGRLGWRGVEPRLFNSLGEVALAVAAPRSALTHHELALELAR
jgi:tetratricopeptide (TPR) repeat protein